MIARKNIFLTGPPSSGKTTVIKKVIARLEVPANGFFTQEERIGDKRVGFLMKSLDGKSAYLAHQDIESDIRIRRYGVSLTNIESLAVPAIKPVEGSVVVVDEIGKMECFSGAFRKAAMRALDSSNIVLGTITYGGDDFIWGVKRREDVELIEVTPENRDFLPDELLEMILSLMK